METDLLRSIMVLTGIGVAAHHLAAAAALKRAPHLVKGFSMPLTVASAVGMVVMGFGGNVQGALYCSLGMVVGMGVTEVMVWRAGAYISAALERQAAAQEAARAQVNQIKSAMYADWEMLQAIHDEEEANEKDRARH